MLRPLSWGCSSPLLPAGFLAAALVYAYAITAHDIFQSDLPLPEVEIRPEAKVVSIGGRCVLLEGKRTDVAYRMFLDALDRGSRGMLITRLHPDRVREEYGLVKVPMFWLATQPGPYRIDPTSLSILQHTIVDFLQKGPPSVLLLEGIEYLMSENPSDKVLRAIYAVRDAVTVSGSQMLVALDPDVLELKDLAMLEREFDSIINEKGAGSEI
jgi:hypothetical protein